MNIETYLKNKERFNSSLPKYKTRCRNCWQPVDTCVCSIAKAFDPNITFVILTHPVEASKRIATGRLAYTCLKNSVFIRGYSFLFHNTVDKLIHDEGNQCFVLYPGRQSHDLSTTSLIEKKKDFSINKKTIIFVIDGTWGNANKMLRLSPNLATLPKICFTPKKQSNFRVRQQPKSFCLSTLEAIHEIIELLGETREFNLKSKKHDSLIKVFNYIVEDQLKKIEKYKENNDGKLNPRSSLIKKRKRLK